MVDEVKFAVVSLLERTGFEPSVPLLEKAAAGRPIQDAGTKSEAT
jgi:hypothetical protein